MCSTAIPLPRSREALGAVMEPVDMNSIKVLHLLNAGLHPQGLPLGSSTQAMHGPTISVLVVALPRTLTALRTTKISGTR